MKALYLVSSAALLLSFPPAVVPAAGQASATASTPSPAQSAFAIMKTMAGEWEGPVTTDMPEEMKASMGGGEMKPLRVSIRVTSRGHAIVHEIQESGTPLDPGKYDHPVTMFYLDEDQIMLLHYCDAGNRPRMEGRVTPDGKSVDFAFVDITGDNLKQHMDHALFTSIDTDHHTEDWTFMLGDHPIHAHFDLHRKSPAGPVIW